MAGADLRQLFVLANAFKEGDLLVGGTRDDRVRDEARGALRAVTLGDIRRTALVEDRVTDALAESLDRTLLPELDPLTVDRLIERLLSMDGADWLRRYRDGLTSEAIAAAAKLMTNAELSALARRLFNPLPGHGITIGAPPHFGSRIQPNSPGDNEEEILFSILEGLVYGCGDVILGINPASDDLDAIIGLEALLHEVVHRLELPTRYCVLSDLRKQHRALERTVVDVGFQSLAGTSKALVGMVGLDVDGLADLASSFPGLYFETGQGSAVTNGVAEGLDMVTLEARAYGVARRIARRTGKWMIVNDVAGFIGPEVFRTPDQLERACLEDSVMAKLHGLTMGLDVCATFHMGISPATLRQLTVRIARRAAPAYLMAVAGNADPMLGYLTTSFREHPEIRRVCGRQITSSMAARLDMLGVSNGRSSASQIDRTATLYALFAKAGGDTRTSSALADEARQKLAALRERGFELGRSQFEADAANARIDRIYSHARQALYATLDDRVIAGASPSAARVRTKAADRDDYLAHPERGEQIRFEDRAILAALGETPGPPQVQIVVSDGLNAQAINEQLQLVLPPVRRRLQQSNVRVGDVDIVIQNGRVRAGYQVGQLIGATAVVHFIGERPGTGLNTMSAYLTYGLDPAGTSRWSPELDHSCTTAVCGIHPNGKAPPAAASDIARLVLEMLETKRSGVRTRDGSRGDRASTAVSPPQI